MTYQFKNVILHIDADAFFASCEQSTNLLLRGKPIVVGKDRGIATAFSYEAKRLGVSRAMTIGEIVRRFPQITLVESDYTKYTIFSNRLVSILEKYIPVVEKTSIDECFGDITGLDVTYGMSYQDLVEKIQDEICTSLGFTCSIGIGPNKLFAKIASRYKKPRGLVFVGKDVLDSDIFDMDIGEISGIGVKTVNKFHTIYVTKIRDFYNMNRERVQTIFGKNGLVLYDEVHGAYVRRVVSERKEQQSFSRVRALQSATNDQKILYAEILQHLEIVTLRLRRQDLVPLSMSIGLKTFNTVYSSEELKITGTTDMRYLITQAQILFEQLYNPKKRYRATFLSFSSVESKNQQMDLFNRTSTQDENLDTVVGDLSNKFGLGVITHLSSMMSKQNRKNNREKTLMYPMINFE